MVTGLPNVVATQELQAILRACERAREQHRPAAMVTVYKTVGSTFRRAGARMLVLAEPADRPSGDIVPSGLGSISGGCLEDDARARARHVMETGRAEAVCYNTTAEADIILGTVRGVLLHQHGVVRPGLRLRQKGRFSSGTGRERQ